MHTSQRFSRIQEWTCISFHQLALIKHDHNLEIQGSKKTTPLNFWLSPRTGTRAFFWTNISGVPFLCRITSLTRWCVKSSGYSNCPSLFMRAGRAYDKSTTATVGRAQFCQCVSRIAEHLGNFWMSHGTTISIGGWKYMRFIVVALVTVPNLPESLSLWYNFDITIHCMFILSTVQSETFPDVFVMGDGHTWGRTSYWLRGIPAEWGPYITKFGHWLGSLSIHNIIHILYYHIKKCPGLTLYICISIYCIKIWTRIGHWKKIPNWSYSLDDGQFHPIPHPSHSRMVVYNVYIFTLYIMYIHIIFSLYRYYIYIYWYMIFVYIIYCIQYMRSHLQVFIFQQRDEWLRIQYNETLCLDSVARMNKSAWWILLSAYSMSIPWEN